MQFKFLHQNYVIPPHNSITPPPPSEKKFLTPQQRLSLNFITPKLEGGGG